MGPGHIKVCCVHEMLSTQTNIKIGLNIQSLKFLDGSQILK